MEDIKLSLEKERSILQSRIEDAERKQQQTEQNMQSLQEELQKSQSSGTKQQAEEKELQARLLNEVEERERAHQEAHQLKKQVKVQLHNYKVIKYEHINLLFLQIGELDRTLEQTRQELARTRANGGQLEEQWHAREQDLLVHLEDSRSREKRLEDQKHNLEICLVDATQQIQELKVYQKLLNLPRNFTHGPFLG